MLRDVAEHGAVREFECRLKRKDKTIIWASLNVRRVCGADGRLSHFEGFIEDITERKRAARALAESEARFRTFFEENSSVMLLVDPSSGEIVSANRAASAFYGYPLERLVGMNLSQIDILPPEELVLDRQRALDKECSFFAYRGRLASGEVREIEVYSSPIVVDGRPLLHGIVHDVTERKRAADALRVSEESLRESQRIAGLGSYNLDIRTGAWSSTEVLDAIFGIDPACEHTIERWEALLHPDDRVPMTAYFAEEVAGKGHAFDKEYRIVRQTDWAERWVHGLGRLDFNAQGRPVRMRGTIKDITERKQAETQLRESEERYRATFEQAAVGIIHVSFEGRILRCNTHFAEILGYASEELTSLTIWQISLPEDQAQSTLTIEQAAKGAAPVVVEKRYICKDGSFTWARITVSMQRDTEGRPQYLIALAEDINARKTAEERLAATQAALRASEERHRIAFQASANAVCIVRLEDGMYLDVNEAFLSATGFERDEVIGRTARELNTFASPGDLQIVAESLRGNSVIRAEFQFKKKSGECVWGLMSASPFEHDGVSCALCVTQDISEAKAAAERLAAATEALRAGEERYRTVFQTSVDGICVSSMSDGRYIDANKAFLDLLGFDREEIVGQTSHGLNLWTEPELREVLVDKLRRDSSFRDVETQFVRKNGMLAWFLISGSVIEIDGTQCVLSIVRDISAAKAAEARIVAAGEALRVSEERYRTAFETSLDAININRLDDGIFVECNRAFLDITGYKREEVIGRTSLELEIWGDQRDRQRLFEMLREKSSCRDLEARFRKKNGEVCLGLMSASVMDIDGVPCMICMTRDISKAKAAEERLAAATEALRVSEERYRTAFQTSLDGITINRLSDGMYIECNKAFLDITAYEREDVIGKTSLELGIWADLRNRHRLVEILRQNSSCRDLEVQFRKKSGEVFWVVVSASLIELDGDTCLLSMVRDISGAKDAEDRIRSLAFYDSLTGLPNRRLLLERLRETLTLSVSSRRRQALLLVNLDHFKMLNETLGHQAGDYLLQEAGRRIISCVGEAGTVAKFEGDEFVVTLDGLGAIGEEAAERARTTGKNILAAVSRPYLLAGREFRSTASIGITVFGDNPETAEEVLQKADIALDQAKAAGRNTLHLFAPEMQVAVNARATLEEDLHQTIKTNQFVLYYQPQLNRGQLIGAEALIRWNHPRRGLLAPGEFIPLAEETGLILPLGDWVLETACKQIARWADRASTAHVVVAVNISARQFRQPDFVQRVLAALDRTGANPRNLDLELTESMLAENIEEIIAKMTELKAHGLRFSLDDFGTGYSSLAYLRRLPLDLLKIDRSFVRDILVDASSGAIAQTILSLSKAMNLPVIAEGVETEEQRKFLTNLGCHSFQGFLFSRPLPLEEFERQWLNSEKLPAPYPE
jgi:diguanylate cyclase (GGDEF)-like protein/PAS domain S-box-containing protein